MNADEDNPSEITSAFIYEQAQLYRSLFERYEVDIAWLSRFIFRSFPSQNPRILELACGEARILKGLAYRGSSTRLSGLDISPRMLELARSAVPDAALYQADMRDFRLGKHYDLILLMANSLSHILSREDRRNVYDSISRHLGTGGLAVCAVLTSRGYEDSLNAPVTMGECSDSRGNRFEVFEQSRMLEEDTIQVDWYFQAETSDADDLHNTFTLHCFQPGELAGEIRESGGEILETLHGFRSDMDFWDIHVYRTA